MPEATTTLPSTHRARAPSGPIASWGEPTGSVSPVRTFCSDHGVAVAGRSSTSVPERCAAPLPVVSVTIAAAAVEAPSARLSSVVAALGSGVEAAVATPAGVHSAVRRTGWPEMSSQASRTPPPVGPVGPEAPATRGVRAPVAVVWAALKAPPTGSVEVRTRPSETLQTA